MSEKLSEIRNKPANPEEAFQSMNDINIRKCQLRLIMHGPQIKKGFSTFKGILNGTGGVINGFDEIYPY